MTTIPGEASSGPAEALKYQTWILKVPIHCEGCKRKVKRVLQTIDGVLMADVDSRLHKVTVKGNVDGETLVQNLVRSGKQAELCPEEKMEKKKKGNEKGGGESKDNDEDGEDHGGEVEVVESGAGGGGGSGGGGKKKRKNKKKGDSNDTRNGGGQVTYYTGSIPSTFGPEQASMVPPSMSPITQDRYFNAYLPMQYPPLATYGPSYNSMYQPPTSDDNVHNVSLEVYLPNPSLETVVIYSDDYEQDEYYEDGGCSIM